jgi:hypothetical protein
MASSIATASAMAFAIDNGFPTDIQTVSLAFFDTNGNLRFGYYDNVTGQMYWPTDVTLQYGGYNIGIKGDPAIAIWEPGRVDVFVEDTAGNYYQCTSTNGTGIGTGNQTSGYATCQSKWGYPGNTPYWSSPAAVGLGDGRLIAGGVAWSSGGDGYEAFYDFGAGTGWVWNTGNFNSALAYASY